jgi:hypothetical protein
LYDGSYKLGVIRNTAYFNMFNVCGIKYLWPDYLIRVGLWYRKKWKEVKTCRINRVLFGNYLKLTKVLSLSKNIYIHTICNFPLGCPEDILSATIS